MTTITLRNAKLFEEAINKEFQAEDGVLYSMLSSSELSKYFQRQLGAYESKETRRTYKLVTMIGRVKVRDEYLRIIDEKVLKILRNSIAQALHRLSFATMDV